MNRGDVLNNLMWTYGKYGFTREEIGMLIDSGLEHDFSYETIYTGLRMALGSVCDETEYFTAAELAEAYGISEEEAIQGIEEMIEELEQEGEDVQEYVETVYPQMFVIPPINISKEHDG